MSGEAEELRYLALQAVDVAEAGALEALLAGLYDESWRVRRVAAEGFERLPAPERAVLPLLAVLGERGQTGARNAAAEALLRVGAPALPALCTLLAHPDPDQRKFAADILGQLGSARCTPEGSAALLAALDDPDFNVRVSAAEALGSTGGAGAAAALQRQLAQPEPLLQLAALDALTRLHHPVPLRILAPLLDNARLRASAYRALGLVDEPEALALLCQGLATSSRLLREAALVALGLQAQRLPLAARAPLEATVRSVLAQQPGLRTLVEEALETGELPVRTGALVAAAALRDAGLALAVARAGVEERLTAEVVHALTQLGPEAGRALAAHLSALPLPARAAVAEVLVQVAAPTSVTALRALLDEPEPELRAVAVRALARSRSPDAIAPLVSLLPDAEQGAAAGRALQQLSAALPAQVRAALEDAAQRAPSPAGLRALGRVGAGGALGILRRAARGADPALRAAALEAAGELGGEPGAELARYGLADEAPAVRRAAARALGRTPSAHGTALLQRALRDEDVGVRLAAVEAAGECAAVECTPQLQELLSGEDGGLAWTALGALTRMGALTPELLQRACEHPDPEVVKAALEAGAAHPVQGLALARGLLGHGRWDVRCAAARALGVLGGRPERALLQRARVDEQDGLVREALSEALERLAQH